MLLGEDEAARKRKKKEVIHNDTIYGKGIPHLTPFHMLPRFLIS
jgi:hypothetical protein